MSELTPTYLHAVLDAAIAQLELRVKEDIDVKLAGIYTEIKANTKISNETNAIVAKLSSEMVCKDDIKELLKRIEDIEDVTKPIGYVRKKFTDFLVEKGMWVLALIILGLVTGTHFKEIMIFLKDLI